MMIPGLGGNLSNAGNLNLMDVLRNMNRGGAVQSCSDPKEYSGSGNLLDLSTNNVQWVLQGLTHEPANRAFRCQDGTDDYFSISGGNNTFFNSLHKDNALWTWIAWIDFVNIAPTTSVTYMASARGNSLETGINFRMSSAAGNNFNYSVMRGTGSGFAVDSTFSGSNPGRTGWSLIQLVTNEASSIIKLKVNGNTPINLGVAYASPSAGNATNGQRMFDNMPGASFWDAPANTRMGPFAWLNVELSDAEMNTLWNTTRSWYNV